MKMNVLHFYLFACIFTAVTYGNPLEVSENAFMEHGKVSDTQAVAANSESHNNCSKKSLDSKDVYFLKDGDLFLQAYNTTVKPSKLTIFKGNLHICFQPTFALRTAIFNRCQKWLYEKNEFTKFPNGSVLLYGEFQEEGTFDITGEGKLAICFFDDEEGADDYDPNNSDGTRKLDDVGKASMIIGKIGSSISIVALLIHIVTFCLVPALRNLPGYNLLALSIAFLMAYAFVIFGQIPEVLGTSCIVSAVLQQYFFLVAFFCTNVMAFDVWKTLKVATERLMLSIDIARKWQFLWYSMYAWLAPLCITVAAVLVDNTESLPDYIKPQYGRHDVCWITNGPAKAAFFLFPAFTLFAINAMFFVMSAFILRRSTLKGPGNQHRQTAKLNFVLYVRLALMMGITWLIAGIALAADSTVIWFIFDIFNSLQGLFVFLLFTCSRKVINHLKDRMGAFKPKNESDKVTTDTTKFDSK